VLVWPKREYVVIDLVFETLEEGNSRINEDLRKDAAANPEQSRLDDSNLPEKPIERAVVSDAEPRNVALPPSPELRSGSAAGVSGSGPAVARAQEEEKVALFVPCESNDLRARWDRIQVNFVDEPRKAVQEADALVAATMTRLAEIFAKERHTLEEEWDRSEDISTEDFRLALRRYRSFFGRLLAI
jgi:hypothetical protein